MFFFIFFGLFTKAQSIDFCDDASNHFESPTLGENQWYFQNNKSKYIVKPQNFELLLDSVYEYDIYFRKNTSDTFLLKKRIFNFDKKQNLIKKTEIDVSGKYASDYEYNVNENYILVINSWSSRQNYSVKYEFDSKDRLISITKGIYKSAYIYYGNCEIIEMRFLNNPASEKWELCQKTVFTLSENNKILSINTIRVDTVLDKTKNSAQSYRTYDKNDSLIEAKYSIWDTIKNDWELKIITQNSYIDSANTCTKIFKCLDLYNNSSTWGTDITVFEYDKNKNLVSRKRNNEIDYECVYNEKNHKISETTYKKVSSQMKTKHLYDDYNNEIEAIFFERYSEWEVRKEKGRSVYTRNNQGEIISEDWYYWNSKTKKWAHSQKNEYIYDSKNSKKLLSIYNRSDEYGTRSCKVNKYFYKK